MPSLVVAGAAGCAGGRPAVFYRLRDLRPVDQVRVVRADRLTVRFRAEYSYRDNLVVSAVRVADGHGAAEAGR